jgi:hypothetical protein
MHRYYHSHCYSVILIVCVFYIVGSFIGYRNIGVFKYIADFFDLMSEIYELDPFTLFFFIFFFFLAEFVCFVDFLIYILRSSIFVIGFFVV